MAGIGFKIEKILEGDTYLDVLKAHFYSAIIFSGPWIMSILTLFSLGYFSPKNILIEDIILFKTVIIYIFAFSLIAVGFLHLSLTRYLSDKLYLDEQDEIAPIFNSASLLVIIIQLIIGIIAVNFIETTLANKFLIVMTYVTISLLWVIMLFLTALRDYIAIIKAFFTGSLIAVFGSIILGEYLGLSGYFLGYYIGHFMIVIMLSARVFIEFSANKFFDFDLFVFLKNNLMLVSMGFFYNLAIWIDKIIFWQSRKAHQINGFLYSYPEYESATFFAFLTIIPALSIFLINIETQFYTTYKHYYSEILNKGTLKDILSAKEKMLESLRSSIGFVVVTQGVISLLALIFSNQLAGFMHLGYTQIPIFRLAIIGAYLNSLFLIMLIIILYFDFKKVAVFVTLIFLTGNAIGTLVTTTFPMPFVGYGYILGIFLGLVCAFYMLDFKLKRLEYETFVSQPLAKHREEEFL